MTRARDVANLIGSGNFSSTTFTATAGQTAFTISHTQGFIQVFMNGLLLDETVDYTSNGSAVTLTSGAAAGDEIEVVAYNTFSVGDALNQAAADTRYVNASGDTMSGDLTIDTNTFHVDVADNRVGIGTTTPYKALTISGAIGGTKADILDIQSSTAGGGTQPMVRFGTEAGNNNTLGRIGFIDIPSYGGGFVVETNSTGGATHTTTEKFRVDKDGRVLTPFQPAFRAYDNETVTNNGVIVFDSVNQRGGTNYSTSNGRFTCPVSGWYHFHFKYLTTSGDTRNDCSLYKNGSVYVEQRNYKSSGNHESYDVVAVDYFNANDYLTCNVVYGDVYNFTTWSSWYGYLIG